MLQLFGVDYPPRCIATVVRARNLLLPQFQTLVLLVVTYKSVASRRRCTVFRNYRNIGSIRPPSLSPGSTLLAEVGVACCAAKLLLTHSRPSSYLAEQPLPPRPDKNHQSFHRCAASDSRLWP